MAAKRRVAHRPAHEMGSVAARARGHLESIIEGPSDADIVKCDDDISNPRTSYLGGRPHHRRRHTTLGSSADLILHIARRIVELMK